MSTDKLAVRSIADAVIEHYAEWENETDKLCDIISNALGEPIARQPDGYAYRYPDCIRFETGGRSINGSKPIEAIPYYLGAPAAESALTRQQFDGAMEGYDVGNTTKQTVLERLNAALRPKEN